MDDLPLAIITAVVGVFFGIIAVVVGIGGGLMYVPYLDFVINIGTTATITSTFVILFTSISGGIKYHSQNRIDKRTALIYLILAIPSSILGRIFKEYVIGDNVTLMRGLFAILIGFTAVFNLYKIYRGRNKVEEIEPEKEKKGWTEHRRIETDDGTIFEYDVKLGVGSLFALLGGFLAGLLGVGGGIIFVPVLTSISGVPIHIAAATSTFMIVFVTITVLLTYAIVGGNLMVVLQWGIPLSIGAVIGARFGAAKARKIESKNLLSAFWVVALLASIRMALGAF